MDSKWGLQPQAQPIKVLLPMLNAIIRKKILTGDLFKCDAKPHGWGREVENERVAGPKL